MQTEPPSASTAEETAAAASQLSRQSEHLGEEIARVLRTVRAG